MTNDQVVRIEGFFEEVGGAGLLLPDGWFGRPMDNRHELTFVAVRPRRLIVELDERLLLTFTGATSVQWIMADHASVDGTPTLAFTDFSQLVFDAVAYGSETPSVRVFTDGTAMFVPAG